MSRSLRLLSYNIQAGLSTSAYSQYLTKGLKHVLPAPSRMANLNGIAAAVADYDLVALQETDAGSLRSGFVNQARYLATCGGFPHVYEQSNRRIGALSQHGNAVLTRLPAARIVQHKLPGLIPGRGALQLRFGDGADALHVFIMHLALGRRDRLRQMRYIAELIGQRRFVVVMGDLNCRSDSRELRELLRLTRLREPSLSCPTFPSWRPSRQLDHILVSRDIVVESTAALPLLFSDHLPIVAQLRLPETFTLAA